MLTPYDPSVDLRELGQVEDRQRHDRITRAWNAYQGDAPDPLRRRKGEINDNVKINFARLIVDAGVAHLFGDQIMVTADESAPEAATQLIEATIRANQGGLLWQKMGVSGGIGGTVFVRIIPRDQAPPRILVLDPATVDVEWEPDDFETITKYTISWNTITEDGAGVARRQIIQPDGTGWIIIDQEAIEGGWITLSETPWPYTFAPILHAQNLPSPHEAYGIADLEPDVLHLCDSINRTASVINRILRLYGFPRTWGKMIGDALVIDANPGSVLRLEHPEAELHNLEMQSDLSSSIDFYRRLIGALHETTRIPEIATGKLDNAGQLSSLALKIMYAPLIQKTETKRRTYGLLIEDLLERVCSIAGYPNVQVQIAWPEILPSDPEGERRTALIDRQLGVSQATILDRLGFDPEVEAAQRAEEELGALTTAQAAFDAGRVAPNAPMPPLG